MSRDRTARPEEPDDDAFSDALDDLFGSQPEAQPPASPLEQHQPSADEPESRAAGTAAGPVESSPPAQYYPQPAPGTPAPVSKQPRPFVQTLGIGCASVLVLMFACMVVLMIIGFLSGDTTTQ